MSRIYLEGNCAVRVKGSYEDTLAAINNAFPRGLVHFETVGGDKVGVAVNKVIKIEP